MIERVQDKSRTGDPAGPLENLPYRIELWEEADGAAVERVLARAFNAQLARAIFRAARSEHPDRRVTLRRGARIIADSAGEAGR
jgi:hypothetical protein